VAFKLLSKEPKGKDIADNDVFTLNEQFTSKLYKVRVPLLAQKDSGQNALAAQKEVSEKIDDDRRHMIEASLVRIMKTRKRIEHNALVTECTKILSQIFMPNPVAIKKRIESLIEREYLERATEDRRFYNYLA
jgi:cullin 3